MGELYKGDARVAAPHFDRAYDLDPTLLQAGIGKALSYQIAGRSDRGIRLLRDLESKLLDRGVTDAEGIYKMAQAYSILGDQTAALRLFRRTIEGGFFCYAYFQSDPLIAKLRGERGASELMEEARRRSESFRSRFALAPIR